MESNENIINRRLARFNNDKNPRLGDFLKLPHGEYVRFCHLWENTIQTCHDGSFHLNESGKFSFSGGLDSGVKRSDITSSEELKIGKFWIFDRGFWGANRGKYFETKFRVFHLKPNADTSGIPQVKEHKKKLFLETVEKVERINGNNKKYILPVPEIQIFFKSITSLECFLKSNPTNVIFERVGGDRIKGQLTTNKEYEMFLNKTEFKNSYYDNASHKNTLFLTEI